MLDGQDSASGPAPIVGARWGFACSFMSWLANIEDGYTVLFLLTLDSNLIATSELELFLLSHFADQTVWIKINVVKVSLESKREQHLAIPFGWGCDVDMADLCQRSRF